MIKNIQLSAAALLFLVVSHGAAGETPNKITAGWQVESYCYELADFQARYYFKVNGEVTVNFVHAPEMQKEKYIGHVFKIGTIYEVRYPDMKNKILGIKFKLEKGNHVNCLNCNLGLDSRVFKCPAQQI